MELGGLRTERERVFLLSSTHGAEVGGLAAFRAVVAAYRETDPIATMERQGALLAEGVNAAARDAGIEQHVRAIGRPSCLVFETRDAEGRAVAGLPHAVPAGAAARRACSASRS